MSERRHWADVRITARVDVEGGKLETLLHDVMEYLVDSGGDSLDVKMSYYVMETTDDGRKLQHGSRE